MVHPGQFVVSIDDKTNKEITNDLKDFFVKMSNTLKKLYSVKKYILMNIFTYLV